MTLLITTEGRSRGADTSASGRSGRAHESRVDDDVVAVAAGLAVEVTAAGDQAQFGARHVAVHLRGGEAVLRVLLDPLHLERRGRPVGPVDDHVVAGLEPVEVEEDALLVVPVDVCGENGGSAFARARGV